MGNLPHGDFNFVIGFKLDDLSNTPDEKKIWYFFEVDLEYPVEVKQKTRNSTFAQKKWPTR